MNLFEALMLICFGISWPISIAKAVRTRIVAGKSPLFMIVLMCGYACGITHKLINNTDWIITLYALNFVMVGIDLTLYLKLRPREIPRRNPSA